jgi:hypothetical protein
MTPPSTSRPEARGRACTAAHATRLRPQPEPGGRRPPRHPWAQPTTSRGPAAPGRARAGPIGDTCARMPAISARERRVTLVPGSGRVRADQISMLDDVAQRLVRRTSQSGGLGENTPAQSGSQATHDRRVDMNVQRRIGSADEAAEIEQSRPGARSTRRSRSLASSASARAREPKTLMLLTP